MSKKGFTVIELVFSIVFLLTAFGLFFTQKNDLQKSMRDQQRKTSINSIYFNLKEVYFKQNNYYPETLKPDTLSGIDPRIFTDPNGILMGGEGSNYSYQTSDCKENQCKNFKLSAKMEKEADFIRQN